MREERRAKVLAGLLEKADREQAARRWERAIAFLEEALKLAPSDEHLQGRLATAREDQQAAQMESFLARAEQAAQSGRWDDAVSALSAYLSLKPGDAAVHKRLAEAQGRQRESRLGVLRMRAADLVKAEKWDEALASWQEYLALAPEESAGVETELRRIKEGRELAQAYAEAQQAIARRAFGQAVDRLEWIIAKDEDYRDAPTLLARAIALRRGQRTRWRNPRVLAVAGAGAGIVVVLGFLVTRPNHSLRLALAPLLSTSTPTSTTAPISMPSQRPTPTPTLTPTPIPYVWHRLYSGEAFPRDTITAIVIDPEDPGVIYVSTAYAGIFKSINGGLSWQPAMAGLGRAWVLSLAIDAQEPRTLYAGISNGGVYKTTDGGGTWQAINEGIDYLGGWEAVSMVALDPRDSQHLYYTQAWQLYESQNGGETWASLRSPDTCPNEIADLVVHPLDGRTLFAADFGHQGCGGGVYKSEDGGRTWSLAGLQLQPITQGGLAIDLQQGELLYATTMDKARTYVSRDAGETWNPLTVGCGVMAVGFQDAAEAYCAIGNDVLKTRDGGGTWYALTRPDLGTGVTSLSASLAAGETILAGGEGLYISVDGGASWAERISGLGASRLDLVLDPSESATLYTVSPDGPCELYRSTDRGRSWTLVTSQGCGLAFDAGGEVLYRYGGNTLWRSRDGGATWVQVAMPQEYVRNVAANPQQPGTVYALYSRNMPPYIYISFDGGQSWQETSGMQDIEDAVLYFEHEEGQTVYAIGDLQASRSRDAGMTWESCADTGAWYARSASRLAIDPRDSDRLFLATRGKGVLISEDGCRSWRSSNFGLGNLFVNTVAIDPQNPDVVYAGTDGGAYLSLSLDGGGHWGVVNGSLLGATVVYSIVVDPQDPDNVYAATPYGIFRLESR